MQDDLFGDLELATPPEPVLMSLNPEYYELMWQGLKTHEFRRRYFTGRATTWYVYLTTPASRLAAVIDLDEAVVDTPRRIAQIADAVRVGNGALTCRISSAGSPCQSATSGSTPDSPRRS